MWPGRAVSVCAFIKGAHHPYHPPYHPDLHILGWTGHLCSLECLSTSNSVSKMEFTVLSNITSYLNTRTRTQASSPLPAFPWALLPHQSPRAASSNCRISLTSNRSCPSSDSGHNHVLLFNRCQSFSSPVHALCSR